MLQKKKIKKEISSFIYPPVKGGVEYQPKNRKDRYNQRVRPVLNQQVNTHPVGALNESQKTANNENL